MEAFIRTQSKRRLVLCKNEFEVTYFGDEYVLNGIDYEKISNPLGFFKKEKTAIKELDRIQKIIIDFMNAPNGVKPVIEINEDYEVE